MEKELLPLWLDFKEHAKGVGISLEHRDDWLHSYFTFLCGGIAAAEPTGFLGHLVETRESLWEELQRE